MVPPQSYSQSVLTYSLSLLIVLWICYSDIRDLRIPNRSLLLLWFLIEIHLATHSWSSEVSAHLFALISLLIALTFYFTIRGAMGMGDIKLFSLIALLTHSIQLLVSALLLACISAGLWAVISRKKTLPFAPSLLLGSLLALHIH